MNNEMVFAIADVLKTRKGIFGINIDYIGDVSRLRKREARAAGLDPDSLRKLSHIENIIFGWNYQRTCSGRANGGEGGEYHVAQMKGARWVAGYEDFIAQSLDGKELYLRGYLTRATKPTVEYIVGTRRATDAETVAIENCITPAVPCAKQLAYGIENEVKPRMFKFSGIICISVPSPR